MTDLNILPYWKERLDNEVYSKAGSESKEYQLKRGYLLHQIIKLHKEYNELLDQEIRTKWFWWYQYNLAKRCLRIFKVKDIYRSPKARAYWKKYYMTKRCKIVSQDYLKHPQLAEFMSLTYQIKNKDVAHQLVWDYVIDYLRNCEVGKDA